MGFPFNEIVTPPALPRRRTMSCCASTVRDVLASMVPEKSYLPSVRTRIQTVSSASISMCTGPRGRGTGGFAGGGFIAGEAATGAGETTGVELGGAGAGAVGAGEVRPVRAP